MAVISSSVVLKIVGQRQRGFRVTPHALVGSTRQFRCYEGVEHSFCVGVRRLNAILRTVPLRIINDLPEGDQNFSAKEPHSLIMFFRFRLLEASPYLIYAAVDASPTGRFVEYDGSSCGGPRSNLIYQRLIHLSEVRSSRSPVRHISGTPPAVPGPEIYVRIRVIQPATK